MKIQPISEVVSWVTHPTTLDQEKAMKTIEDTKKTLFTAVKENYSKTSAEYFLRILRKWMKKQIKEIDNLLGEETEWKSEKENKAEFEKEKSLASL